MANRKFWIIVLAAIGLFVLAGCTTGTAVQPDCPPLNRFGQKNIGNTGTVCNYEGPIVVTPSPTEEAAAAEPTVPAETESDDLTIAPLQIDPDVANASDGSTATPANGACMTNEEIQKFAVSWEEIDRATQNLSSRIHHPAGPWTAGAGDVVLIGVYWSPEDPTLNGKLEEIRADGLTGAWRVLQDVVMEGPGASISCIPSLHQVKPAAEVGGQCLAKSEFVAIVNMYRLSGASLFNRLDEFIDLRPEAQVRMLGGGVFPAADPATRILWTSQDVTVPTGLPLHSAAGMTASVLTEATDADIVGQTWRGVILCDPLDPEVDFETWWGK
jgi:hypothetical protein